MNLRECLKQKIIENVLSVYNDNWSILVYDASSARIIQTLFTKSALLAFNITAANHIEEERTEFDFPAIYFVTSTKEISKVINSEFSAKKYSDAYVCSLSKPDGLNQIIKHKTVSLNIEALEERVFLCAPSELSCISNIIDAKLSFNYLPCTRQLAITSHEKASSILNSIQKPNNGFSEESNKTESNKGEYTDASVLLIDRTVDMFTPFVHFFTFKSILSEILETKVHSKEKESVMDFTDQVFRDIRYKHIGEVNEVLQSYINKLNRNLEQLNKKKVDTASLGKMVMDAPKNIETKEAIEKYAKLLAECINRLEFLTDLVEVEQVLVTGYDRMGKKKNKGIDFVFDILGSRKYGMEDKLRVLYIMKAMGVSPTRTECEILGNFGFSKEDIGTKLNLINFIKRSTICEYKYDVSRFQPILNDLITDFLKDGKGLFTTLNPISNSINSLRKSTMISCDKKSHKRILVVYVTNGITHEECRLAYVLSEMLGVELIIGSDKIISSKDFIGDIKANKNLREKPIGEYK